MGLHTRQNPFVNPAKRSFPHPAEPVAVPQTARLEDLSKESGVDVMAALDEEAARETLRARDVGWFWFCEWLRKETSHLSGTYSVGLHYDEACSFEKGQV